MQCIVGQNCQIYPLQLTIENTVFRSKHNTYKCLCILVFKVGSFCISKSVHIFKQANNDKDYRHLNGRFWAASCRYRIWAQCLFGVELRQSMSDAVETNFDNCQIKFRVLQLKRFGSFFMSVLKSDFAQPLIVCLL